MNLSRTLKESTLLLGLSIIIALLVNIISPRGISLLGQWDETKGVVLADTKDHEFFEDMEIESAVIAKEIYDKNKALFVDTRDSESYLDGHIKGAVSFPVGEFAERFNDFETSYGFDSLIITYCSGRSCIDSHNMAQLLYENGFTRVSVFIDGFSGWQQEGYPVE